MNLQDLASILTTGDVRTTAREPSSSTLRTASNSRQNQPGIATEADAFARLSASCDLTASLAIAWFGYWGSGKGFLMSVQRPARGLTEKRAVRC
jgi:hypothetical protein